MFWLNSRIFLYFLSIFFFYKKKIFCFLFFSFCSPISLQSARTSIYRNIYICLLLIEVLFLVGIEQVEANIIFCGFTTVFLHCAILTAIAWFCFEGKFCFKIKTACINKSSSDVFQTTKKLLIDVAVNQALL